MLDQGKRLPLILFQTLGNHRLVIIFARNEPGTVNIADVGNARRLKSQML